MAYNVSTDLWFQYFNSDGPQWLLLLVAFAFRSLWATLALLFNFGILYITTKSNSLRGTCNILIAMESGFALVLDLGYYVSFLVVLSGAKFVRYEHCFWAVIVPCLFGDMAQLTMVLTGVDRLCCVMFPIWYKKRNSKCYLTVVLALLCCYGTYDFIINYIDYLNSKDVMVSCSTTEMGNGDMGTLMKINGLTLSGILMVVYSLCWFFVFKLSAVSKNVNSDNRKLIKSLVFIIALNLAGVFVKCSVNLLLQSVFRVNAFTKMAFAMAFSFLTITVYGANAPILFIVSNEYRNRFTQNFPWLWKFVRKSEVTTVYTNTLTTMDTEDQQKNNGTMDNANFYHQKISID